MNRKAQKDYESINSDYELLYKRREILDESRMKHSDSLDKYLLTFSTGSLYLSINFTNNLKHFLLCKKLLGIGWIFLIVSIVTVLVSFYLGVKAHERAIEINDEFIDSLSNEGTKGIDETNVWNTPIHIFNIISIISFITGVVLLSWFYFINL